MWRCPICDNGDFTLGGIERHLKTLTHFINFNYLDKLLGMKCTIEEGKDKSGLFYMRRIEHIHGDLRPRYEYGDRITDKITKTNKLIRNKFPHVWDAINDNSGDIVGN